MKRFYWVVEGRLAGCSRPGAHDAPVADDLAGLHRRGIRAMLSLTETPVPQRDVASAGLEALHLPVDDFYAPTTGQMLQAFAFIDLSLAENRPVAVHCLAGQGRTGTILAAWLLRAGYSADEAILEIRAIAPGAIESARQVAALQRWAAERPWLV
ncbi:MAG: dual specificity protein phosphatase family protein [Thermomicrobiales bacterium]|nr:dual specificity protein phosphatase family protein [Thermomicrobiales bacterium]